MAHDMDAPAIISKDNPSRTRPTVVVSSDAMNPPRAEGFFKLGLGFTVESSLVTDHHFSCHPSSTKGKLVLVNRIT